MFRLRPNFIDFGPRGGLRIKWKSSGYPKSGPFWCAVLRGVRTERAAVPRAPSGRQGPKTWALRFGARRAAVPRAPSGRQGLRHGLLFEFLACPAPGESLVSNPCTHAERGRGIAGCEMSGSAARRACESLVTNPCTHAERGRERSALSEGSHVNEQRGYPYRSRGLTDESHIPTWYRTSS